MPYSPKQIPIACVALTVYLSLLTGAAFSQPYHFPPRLAPGHFLRDAADLLNMNNRVALETLQKRIYAQTNSPLVVVTIDRMSTFTSTSTSPQIDIGTFARAWFNHWAIGSAEHRTGILLLISEADRRARIELGAAWGRRWDRHCELIMKGAMIPAFKKGDYDGGILAGAQALADMAAQGPHGVAPSLGIVAELMTIPLIEAVQEWQALSPRWGLLTLVFGLLSMVVSLVIRRCRGILFFGGLVLLVGGFLPILLLILPLVPGYFLSSERRPRGAAYCTDGRSPESWERHQAGL